MDLPPFLHTQFWLYQTKLQALISYQIAHLPVVDRLPSTLGARGTTGAGEGPINALAACGAAGACTPGASTLGPPCQHLAAGGGRGGGFGGGRSAAGLQALQITGRGRTFPRPVTDWQWHSLSQRQNSGAGLWGLRIVPGSQSVQASSS